MEYVLMVIAGLWMADGVALLFAHEKMIELLKVSLAESPGILNWSWMSVGLGLLLIVGGWALPYQPLWVLLGVAMAGKGLFLVAAPEDLRQSVLKWCLEREAIDYRIWGMLLCLMSILLIDATGILAD